MKVIFTNKSKYLTSQFEFDDEFIEEDNFTLEYINNDEFELINSEGQSIFLGDQENDIYKIKLRNNPKNKLYFKLIDNKYLVTVINYENFALTYNKNFERAVLDHFNFSKNQEIKLKPYIKCNDCIDDFAKIDINEQYEILESIRIAREKQILRKEENEFHKQMKDQDYEFQESLRIDLERNKLEEEAKNMSPKSKKNMEREKRIKALEMKK